MRLNLIHHHGQGKIYIAGSGFAGERCNHLVWDAQILTRRKYKVKNCENIRI